MRKKYFLAGFFLVLIFSAAVFALTADDYYGRAANKYINEDLAGAQADLLKALELEPGHEKANDLLVVVRKELGKAGPATPTTSLAPTPTTLAPKPQPAAPRPAAPRPAAPRPAAPKPAAPKPAVIKPEPAAPAPEPAEIKMPVRLLAPQPTAKFADMQETISQIMLLLLTVIVFSLVLAARGTYFVIRDAIARSRMITCPDCRTKNEGSAEFCSACGTRIKVWSGVTKGQRKWFARFNWKGNPFGLTVIPQLFTGYTNQVNSILEKIASRSGHILAYGGKGVGKTTLLRWLADNLGKDNHAIYVARPPINFDDLIKLIVDELKAHHLFGKDKKVTLYEVEALVKKAKKPVVILLDEAHEFTPEIEQQMRSLGDIPGVNFVLAGLPETRDKIKRESPPLFDRIILEVYLDHLDRNETRDLILKRIESVGGKEVKPFTEEAIDNIFKMSKGRPRMILKVCDWVVTDAIRNNLEEIGAGSGHDFPAGTEEGKPAVNEGGGQT